MVQVEPGVTVYAAGDIADCRRVSPQNSGAAETAALLSTHLAANQQAAVLTLGDHTYPVGLLAEFTDCYEPTWGKFKQRTFPAPGNHEYYSPLAGGYFTYFGAAAGPDRRGYYSFRLGDWHVVSLNSYLKPIPHRKQIDWLKSDLAANKTKCTLAFWHHPRFSSGGHGDNPHMQEIWEILQESGAEVVLSSHDHNYERFALQDAAGNRDDLHGMRQIVVGTGGARLTPLRFPAPHSEARDNSVHGVLKLVLRADSYEWEFLPAEADAFTDSGTGRCR